METNEITIVGAKVHNLKNISIKIPKNQLVVFTGPSGSGKTSLAFDTIYVEGQRRYMESLSSYAKQVLGILEPPDVEFISGLSPALAVNQNTINRNPRSTVGTTTEIYDLLRVLYSKIGMLHCPDSGHPIKRFTPNQICNDVLKFKNGTKVQVFSPVNRNRNTTIENTLPRFVADGFSKVKIKSTLFNIDDVPTEYLKSKDEIQVVIDRIIIKENIRKRLIDSIEYALKIGSGSLYIEANDEILFFSEKNISPATGNQMPDLTPSLFSFNSPVGACPSCHGIGEKLSLNQEKMILDSNLSIFDGAIKPIQNKKSILYKMVVSYLESEMIDIRSPIKNLDKSIFQNVFYGTNKIVNLDLDITGSDISIKSQFPGIIPFLEKKFFESKSKRVKDEVEQFMSMQFCNECRGGKLNRFALSTFINSKSISSITKLTILDFLNYINQLKFENEEKYIADKIIKELKARSTFLINVGLEYLTLDRHSNTLSGGEAQRIRLATQIGSSLSGVIYVLDEPSIGLHHRDNVKLIETLKSLRDSGNSVLVVEHDHETIAAADYIVDLGPASGIFGGEITFSGNYTALLESENETGTYINSSKILKDKTDPQNYSYIELFDASMHNLKNVDIKIPKKSFTCITGVSGSGKSTLIHKVLIPAIRKNLIKNKNIFIPATHYRALSGISDVKNIIELDQSPIGKSSSSNPATFCGIFDEVRKIFAATSDSKIRGYNSGKFSFNVKGGRCEECEGDGIKKINMHFLSDMYVTCSECSGKRYNPEILSIYFKNKNIYDILDLTVAEAEVFFKNHEKIQRVLNTLNKVGLGYLKLGQAASTLSGGESQRLKLARELSKRTQGHTLYILDEPTTGLHFSDIKILLELLESLIEKGNSLIVIEHNLDIIIKSDYIIDLGPEGGGEGGNVVFSGSPHDIIKCEKSYTGLALKEYLGF